MKNIESDRVYYFNFSKIDRQANVFKDVDTQYHGVKGDFVYSGLGGFFIGNNPNAKQVSGLGFGVAHSEANQNINNFKYVESDNNSIENKSN